VADVTLQVVFEVQGDVFLRVLLDGLLDVGAEVKGIVFLFLAVGGFLLLQDVGVGLVEGADVAGGGFDLGGLKNYIVAPIELIPTTSFYDN